MAPKVYAWISIWFMMTAPLMIWDAGYCLMRPRSMVGGDLHWAWKLYEFYGQIDKVYGVKAFEDGDGFANAAAILNLLENFSAITYLVLLHICKSDASPLFGYTASALTLGKTILYLSQEYFCGWCAIGHNDINDLLVYWIGPNVVWCTLSGLIMYRLGGDIVSSLSQVPKISKSE